MNARTDPTSFDAEITLDDLFGPAERAQWEAWLSTLAGGAVHIVPPDAADATHVVQHELEPLLALAVTPPATLDPALLALFEAHVRERIRYRLACTLQTDASAHDYAALQASEARYRTLAGELEQRVQAQVADLQRARLYAFQAEHLRAVAALAAGMAHEINNPIGFVAANLRSAREYLDELIAGGSRELLEEFNELLDETQAGVTRVAHIVAQLRVFAQVDASLLTPAGPRALAEAAAALLVRERPPGVGIRIEGDPPPFTCEAAALSQALLQLLRNALQAMAGRSGTVDVALHAEGGELRIEVRDSGCGMSADVLARACDPFFSTRDVGQGVGLGLAIAAEVARHHGGQLALQSQPGEGCTAVLTLREGAR